MPTKFLCTVAACFLLPIGIAVYVAGYVTLAIGSFILNHLCFCLEAFEQLLSVTGAIHSSYSLYLQNLVRILSFPDEKLHRDTSL